MPSPPVSDQEVTALTSVTALCAVCDRRDDWSDDWSQRFSIGEFAILETGDRIALHFERGFTLSSMPGDFESIPANLLIEQIHDVVASDDDEISLSNRWLWLAGLANKRGLEVTAAQLRELPYEILITDRVVLWLTHPDEGG
ncbi:MAG: hypothetical protein OXI29_08440 [bacterium]|nr:hypothetical protein [bacterium]MYG59685.1 hypothetical protein [Acidimicrobiia bacterium]MYG70840.1 hypothetical protein [Acidimicrobiia bacterium]MYJ31100.1 hypothetical protein [Acidimicrobiia bacterium]MYJ62260.1 hypothetical protein [Acidimicrobiia bacterium]